MSLSNQPYRQMEHPAGVAFTVVNPLIDYWLASWNGSNPLLDIGCGSCHNSQKAIESGARVLATEMNEKSLQKVREDYSDQIGQISFELLQLPNHVDLPKEHFSGILCSEVFHFLNHEEILASIQHFHQLLIPGGKAVLTCACEDIEVFKSIGLKERKEECRQTEPNRLDPVFNYLDFLDQAVNLHEPDHQAWEIRTLHRKIQPRSFFNFINPDQLAQAFNDAGFDIELITTGAAPYYPVWEHGEHDQVRLVATRR